MRLRSSDLSWSTSTRVRCPRNVSSCRNSAGCAPRDRGATIMVESHSEMSDWRTTAYRWPRCSCPVAPFGAGTETMSPRRVKLAEELVELSNQRAIAGVVREALRVGLDLRAPRLAGREHEC